MASRVLCRPPSPGRPVVRPTVWHYLSQLKNLAQKELLVKVKASYKLSDALKKPAPKKVTPPPHVSRFAVPRVYELSRCCETLPTACRPEIRCPTVSHLAPRGVTKSALDLSMLMFHQ